MLGANYLSPSLAEETVLHSTDDHTLSAKTIPNSLTPQSRIMILRDLALVYYYRFSCLRSSKYRETSAPELCFNDFPSAHSLLLIDECFSAIHDLDVG